MATEITADYRCTQAEFYAIVRLLIKNYKANLAKFTTHKPKYTLAFGDAILTALDAAEAMKSKEERDADAETFRQQMIPMNKKCTDNWNILESYIKGVWDKTEWKPQLQAAGSNDYDKAVNKNWEYTKQMNVAAHKFFTVPANLTKLLDGGNNMPAGFPAAYDADALLFFNKYTEYSSASETTTATADKLKANNAVYASAMSMIDDGKVIGQNDAAFLKLFTWQDLKDFVSPPGSASLTIDAQDKISLAPILEFTIVMQAAGGTQINLTSDAVTGVAKQGGLDPNTYKGIAKATGFKDLGFLKDVNTGVNAHVTLLMEKV